MRVYKGFLVALMDSLGVEGELVGMVLREDFCVDFFHTQSFASHVFQKS